MRKKERSTAPPAIPTAYPGALTSKHLSNMGPRVKHTHAHACTTHAHVLQACTQYGPVPCVGNLKKNTSKNILSNP